MLERWGKKTEANAHAISDGHSSKRGQGHSANTS